MRPLTLRTMPRNLLGPSALWSVAGPAVGSTAAFVAGTAATAAGAVAGSAPVRAGAQALDTLLDRLVADIVGRVDLDAVARRLDIEAVLDRLDLTETVMDRVDLPTVAAQVLRQLDARGVDEVVSRVDVDAIAARLDLDAVAARLDLDAVLDRLDLTETVLRRVDLRVVVDAVLAQVDLIALAEQVIDGVDLPEIIRESTGTMASDTVRGVRMQGIEADQAVGRAMDRLLLRHARRPGDAPS
jgi:hypothetical protein